MPDIYQQLTTRLQKAVPQARHARQLLAILWKPARGVTIAWLGSLVVAALLPVASILLLKWLVDGVIHVMKVGASPASTAQLLMAGGLLAAIAVAMDVLSGAAEWIRTAQTESIQDHVASLIQRQSVAIDYAFYECPEFFDRLYRARDESKDRIPLLLEHAGSVFQNCITLAALSMIIARYSGLLILVLASSLVPAFYVIARFHWLMHEWWRDTTADRRWLDYYDRKFSQPASAADIRLLGLGKQFEAAYRDIRVKIRSAHLSLIRKQTITRGAAAVAGVLIAGVPVGWMAWQATLGRASFGDLVIFYQAFLGGQGFMRAVTMSMAQVYSDSLYVANLCEFLELKPGITDPAVPAPRPDSLHRGIEFHDVTFRYPGSDRVALMKLDLAIPAGKIVVIVGPNGAGKSTLVKLLNRFYDPAEGYISLDGVPLSQFALEDLRSFYSTLSQMPVNYDAPVSENIAWGDIDLDPSTERIEEAARRAGADQVVERLPGGYDTLLGKSFANGTELSAGEWQRISMARAFFRQAPVVLLDEPTSFMDPWAEHAWFDRLRDLAKNRTAVVVTHRFTIAMRADLIHVMDAGRVVESGTHAQLIANGKLYAESWFEQVAAGEMADSELKSVAVS